MTEMSCIGDCVGGDDAGAIDVETVAAEEQEAQTWRCVRRQGVAVRLKPREGSDPRAPPGPSHGDVVTASLDESSGYLACARQLQELRAVRRDSARVLAASRPRRPAQLRALFVDR